MRVFNVPASAPFLRTVIAALVDGKLVRGFEARTRPELLLQATLYLPTQRACRMAREIFLDVLGTDAVLLPRIAAIGDIDEDELEFSQIQSAPDFTTLDVPPALDTLQRRLTLARLVAAWAKQLKPGDPAATPLVTGGPAATLALADDLARLMDDMTTRGVDWSALDGLVPDDLDRYWQLTLEFLRIAKETWPGILKATGTIEPAQRRDRLIEAEAARLAAQHQGPVIAAGSTGSMPATARFLHAIAKLKQGAVVLPGLDTDLDEAAWNAIGGTDESAPLPSHPQFALHALLARFGLKRGDIEQLAAPAPHARDLLTSETMRPASASADWYTRLAEPDIAQKIDDGTHRLSVIEAANPEMEALAIAVAMRDASAKGMSAALVTPDRALARRVMAALGRWKLAFDDSGGDSLMDAQAGIFARLAAQTAADDLAPVSLLALIKHPLFRLGGAAGAHTQTIADLEVALFRGTRPASGCAGLARDFARFAEEHAKLLRKELSAIHSSELRATLDAERIARVQDFIGRLCAALAPLDAIKNDTSHDFAAIAVLHRSVLTELSRDDNGVIAVFEGDDGEALAAAFDDLTGPEAASGLAVTRGDYPELFKTAFAERVVRRPQNAQAKLRIYGPLEARLTQNERVILGGLVEGIWPPAPRIDPWLSRPMRHDLGLDLPERRIGLSAHDLAQLLGAPEVILTHAAKIGGAPAVASRFLHRLEAVIGETRWKETKQRGDTLAAWAGMLDEPADVSPQPAPQPKPPRALRPLRMSVTEIEHWLRDPYTIYARRILKLLPLDPVDMPLSAADRGSAIHAALGEFAETYPGKLPDDPARALIDIGKKHFAPLMERPEARALWWPRFLRIAEWFGGWETGRRINVASVDAETRGEISIPLDGGRSFILSARADRIEHREDRTFAIVDYKTGSPPSGKQVRLGLSPQLTLEAAILREGGFGGIDAGGSVSEIVYVKLSGNNPPGKEQLLELKLDRSDEPQSPDDAAVEARQKLEALIRAFESEDQAYNSMQAPMWSSHYGTYDDLARVKEWSANAGKGDEQ
ncbi:MAG: double-strand break repair protein AddB [Bradyrhizobiaceae bacterium]|nr:MAG: double-strand break repair protein AddB [Bradyrhizobiaceae bacterium]